MRQQRVLVWIFVGACTGGDRPISTARDDLPPAEPEDCPVRGSAPRPTLGPDQIAACPMLDADQVAGADEPDPDAHPERAVLQVTAREARVRTSKAPFSAASVRARPTARL
jgi:hypothetical protein